MNLLLDFGNTRLKWAVASDDSERSRQIVERGIVSYESVALAAWAIALQRFPLAHVQFSSVVMPDQETAVFAALGGFGLVPVRFEVGATAGVLRNAYATPDTLGVDRWAAAIGAWALVKQSCLVVGAGTATTVDVIEAAQPGEAVYRGGLILPGLELMVESLHQRTARLPNAAGRYCAAPEVADNTHDAITSGVLDATCGAIERMGQRLPAGSPWLVAGGNAEKLQRVLGPKLRIEHDLVLQGLAARFKSVN